MTAGAFPRAELSQGHEIYARTLGIIGLGAIGQAVARMAQAFKMTVVAYDVHRPDCDPAWSLAKRVDLETLLTRADVVTLHVPLTEATRSMIDRRALSAMKPGAILINTARGGIVDEAALGQALRSGQIGGAALDVFEAEPITPETGHLFAGLSNIILSPHVSGVTHESNARISALIAERIATHLADPSP